MRVLRTCIVVSVLVGCAAHGSVTTVRDSSPSTTATATVGQVAGIVAEYRDTLLRQIAGTGGCAMTEPCVSAIFTGMADQATALQSSLGALRPPAEVEQLVNDTKVAAETLASIASDYAGSRCDLVVYLLTPNASPHDLACARQLQLVADAGEAMKSTLARWLPYI